MFKHDQITEMQTKLQGLLDDCMSGGNQDGSLKITKLHYDYEDGSGTGEIKFEWCIIDEEPWFQGY